MPRGLVPALWHERNGGLAGADAEPDGAHRLAPSRRARGRFGLPRGRGGQFADRQGRVLAIGPQRRAPVPWPIREMRRRVSWGRCSGPR
jgi:hypothetical protein